LLVKSFGIKDKWHLAVTVMIFFDLNNPDLLLSEQELWRCVLDQLGEGGVLDPGMPKPRGEALVTGACFAPRGETRAASSVSVGIGESRKDLSVFGHRYWKRVAGTVKTISDPEPFSQMPITYQNAFGGQGFDRNPLGKGIHPVSSPGGKNLVPLPNIELSRHLIGSPSDRPEPAGFGPMDLMWPQRAKKQGTYDEKWQRERQPCFPDDMDYEFFNTAPEDQYISEFFTGDEAIEVRNMHPDAPMIHSHLPRLRIRCFVTRKKDLKTAPRKAAELGRIFFKMPTTSKDEIFKEVDTHIDTVWLFPTILRGLVMFRGVTETLDDEFTDVRRIFLASEKPDEEPKPLEHYLEEQQKLLDRTVPITPEPLQEADKEVAQAIKQVKKIPKLLKADKLRALGKTPLMPRTPPEMAAGPQTVLKDNLALLANMETMTRDLEKSTGASGLMDPAELESWKNDIRNESERIQKSVKKFENVQQEMETMKKETGALLKEKVSPEDLEKTGVDPDNLLPEKSINPWHDRGFPLVIQWRRNLEQNQKTLNALYALGFEEGTISDAWLGINPENKMDDAKQWGLTPEADNQGKAKPLVLPSGLVIPRFHEATLNRILIRPGDYSPAGEDILVKGSDEVPLVLHTVTDGSPSFIRVTEELEALLVEQEAGDACSVIALSAPGEKPDKDAEQALKDAPVFLIVLPKGPEAEKEWASWQGAYPNAQKLALPEGNTVFEAREKGTDIRQWILDALPPEGAEEDDAEPEISKKDKAPGKSLMAGLASSLMGLEAMIQGHVKEMMGIHQKTFDGLMAEKKEMEGQAREHILKAGKDPDKILSAAEKQPKESFSEMGDDMAKKIAEQREKIRATGQLTPEIEKKMNEEAAHVAKLGRKSDAIYKDGMARLEAAKKANAETEEKALSGELPPEMKEQFKAAGIDPDQMKQLTREEVIDRYEKGISLSGANLSDVDLSELDLHEIDLSKTMCHKTKFSETILDGANLFQAQAMEADFSKASLKNAKMEKGMFMKAVLKDADLSNADLGQAMFQEADLSQADLTGAQLDRVMLLKAKLSGATLTGVTAEMGVFSEADATNADFSGARLIKCLFKDTILDQADFSETVLNSTMFWGVTGEEVTFQGANMDKGRMGGQASLPGADFRNITMSRSCFRDSDLSGVSFQGSNLDMSILENCNLEEADFFRVSVRKCRFAKSNLEKANMEAVNLFQGSLRKARLVSTDLRFSNLYGVDFYKAVFGNTLLDGANLKMTILYKRTDLLS